MSIIIEDDQIKEHIIHRHENLLLDRIIINKKNEGKGHLEVTISENDHLGRDLFLKEKSHGKKVIIVPIYMEILALAAIACTGKMEKDQIVFFTGISRFKKLLDLEMNHLSKGYVEKVSEKKGFLKYSGMLNNHKDELAANGTMTAFFTAESNIKTEASEKKVEQNLPDFNTDNLVNKDNYSKNSHKIKTIALTSNLYPMDR